jgi:hypothetical protein
VCRRTRNWRLGGGGKTPSRTGEAGAGEKPRRAKIGTVNGLGRELHGTKKRRLLGDHNEPPHVHVERDDKVAKFWLDPVRLQSSKGVSGKELNRIRKLVEENQERFQRRWNEYFEN